MRPPPSPPDGTPPSLTIEAESLEIRRIGPLTALSTSPPLAAQLKEMLPRYLLAGGEVRVVGGDRQLRFVTCGNAHPEDARPAPDQVGLTLEAIRDVSRWDLAKRLLAGNVVFDVDGADNVPIHFGNTVPGSRRFTTAGAARPLGTELTLDWPPGLPEKLGLKLLGSTIEAAARGVVDLELADRRWRLRRPWRPRLPSDVPLLELRPEWPLVEVDVDRASAVGRALRTHHGEAPVLVWDPPFDPDPELGPDPHLLRVEAYDLGHAWRFATVGLASAPGETGALAVELTIDVPRTDAMPPPWAARLLELLASQLTACPEVPRPGAVFDADVVDPEGRVPAGGVLWVASPVPAAILPDGRVPFVAAVPLSRDELLLAQEFGVSAFAAQLSRRAPPPLVRPHRPDLGRDPEVIAAIGQSPASARTVAGLAHLATLPDGALELQIDRPLAEVLALFEDTAPIRLVGEAGEVVLRHGLHVGRHRELRPGHHAVWIRALEWHGAREAARARAGRAMTIGPVDIVETEPRDPLAQLQERARRVLEIAVHLAGAPGVTEDPRWGHLVYDPAQERFTRALREFADPERSGALAEVRSTPLMAQRAAAAIRLGPHPPEMERLAALVDEFEGTRVLQNMERMKAIVEGRQDPPRSPHNRAVAVLVALVVALGLLSMLCL